MAAANQHGVSLWTVIGQADAFGLEVNKGALTKIESFRQLIMQFVENAQTLPANQVGTMIVKQSGIMADIYQDATPENLSRQENVEELVNGIEDFCEMRVEEGNENISLSDYLSEISLLSDVDTDKGGDEHKITLMTIHSSKGLEFGTVFVVGMEEGLFPSDMVSGSPRAMEEERRLCYVAITRAKTHCFLSYAQCRFRFGQMEFSAPSRFLSDIAAQYLDRNCTLLMSSRSLEDDVELPWQRRSRASASNVSSFSEAYKEKEKARPFRPSPAATARPSVPSSFGTAPSASSTLTVGSHIIHNRFGRGEVLRLDGTGDNTKATVQFENVGTKQLLLKFAKFDVID